MIPCLYEASETKFITNGIGKLADCTSCLVTEKRNGEYELEMTYPPDGIHVDDLVNENIIMAKPSETASNQAFRIYKVDTAMSGELEISARHISYQLNYVTVSPTTVVTGGNDQVNEAYAALVKNATADVPFTFETDIESSSYFGILEPVSFKAALGGVDGSILDTFGGEYEWDMYTIKLHKARGEDNGVKIIYGKNLIDFNMEKSVEDVITAVHPYWIDSETNDVMELSEKIVSIADDDTPYEKVALLDCNEQFEEQPTESDMRTYAESYLNSASYVEPTIDIDIDFYHLWNTPGYEDIVEAERVSLCDTVHVYVSTLGIEVEATVTETVYNTLLERYDSITLSNSKTSSRNSSFALTVATTSQVKALIALTDESIRLSVSKRYATIASLNDYSTTTEIQSLIEETVEGIEISYTQAITTSIDKALSTDLVYAGDFSVDDSSWASGTDDDGNPIWIYDEKTAWTYDTYLSSVYFTDIVDVDGEETQVLAVETSVVDGTSASSAGYIKQKIYLIAGTYLFTAYVSASSSGGKVNIYNGSVYVGPYSVGTSVTEINRSFTIETSGYYYVGIRPNVSGITYYIHSIALYMNSIDYLEGYYTTTETVQSMINVSEAGITSSFTKTLESYSTTEQIQSMIEASQEGITLLYTNAITNALGDYSTTNQIQSMIEASQEGIILSVTQTIEEELTTDVLYYGTFSFAGTWTTSEDTDSNSTYLLYNGNSYWTADSYIDSVEITTITGDDETETQVLVLTSTNDDVANSAWNGAFVQTVYLDEGDYTLSVVASASEKSGINLICGSYAVGAYAVDTTATTITRDITIDTAGYYRIGISPNAANISFYVYSIALNANSLDYIESSYTKNSEVRSRFAMDTTSVSIESGTITFEAGTLVIKADNFTLDEKGNATFGGTLDSASGTFVGTLTNTNSSGSLTTTIKDGQIIFSNSTYGDVATMDGSFLLDISGTTYTGVCITGNTVAFDTPYLSALDENNTIVSTDFALGQTGYMTVVYEIFESESTGTMFWNWCTLQFVSGLMVTRIGSKYVASN